MCEFGTDYLFKRNLRHQAFFLKDSSRKSCQNQGRNDKQKMKSKLAELRKEIEEKNKNGFRPKNNIRNN